MKREKRHLLYLPYILGILAVTIGYLPYLLLQKKSIVSITDQLDGEIVAYYLHGKHLFDGSSIFAEIMCGMNKNALVPPSRITVLLYAFLSPFQAFMANQYIVLLMAFIGMYLLSDSIVHDKRIAFVTGGFFSFLPFHSVYGLSIAGLPLLAYCILSLYSGKKKSGYYLGIVFYCFASSFVLIGFGIVGVLSVISIIVFSQKKASKEFLTVPVLVLTCYMVQNCSLILQVLGIGPQEISHKEEIVVQGMGFWQGFKSVFWDGIDYAPAYQKYIIIPAALVVLSGGVFWGKLDESGKFQIRLIFTLFASAVLIGLFYAAAHCHRGAQFRNTMGGAIKYFQADRLYWFYPVIWYTIFACVCAFILKQLPKLKYFTTLLLIGMMGVVILKGSNFKLNMHQLLRPGTTGAICWEEYFAQEQYSRIAAYIEETTGLKQSEYRVASLGIHPAVAVMNGFYTIDMYSNNYSLEYKHTFREIIAKEIEKSVYNQTYFDQWGNRCYLCSAQYGFSALIGKKDNAVFENLELNTEKMSELHCCYILSAGEIATAANMNLVLEETFDSDNSYYRIYLYKLKTSAYQTY